MTDETDVTQETPETTRRAAIAYTCAALAFLVFVGSSFLQRLGLEPQYASAIGFFAAGLLLYPANRHMAITHGRQPVSFVRWAAITAAASIFGFILVAPAVEWGLDKLLG